MDPRDLLENFFAVEADEYNHDGIPYIAVRCDVEVETDFPGVSRGFSRPVYLSRFEMWHSDEREDAIILHEESDGFKLNECYHEYTECHVVYFSTLRAYLHDAIARILLQGLCCSGSPLRRLHPRTPLGEPRLVKLITSLV